MSNWREVLGSETPGNLTEEEINNIINEFLDEPSKLSNLIKNMPINRVTETILFKLRDRVEKQGYLTEQGVYDMLSNEERHYLYSMQD